MRKTREYAIVKDGQSADAYYAPPFGGQNKQVGLQCQDGQATARAYLLSFDGTRSKPLLLLSECRLTENDKYNILSV